ncbi:MAG: regulatory protein RecX [Pyrinomonadaceae bacterium]
MRRRLAQSKEEESLSARLDPQKARERTFQRAVKLLAAKSRSVAELRERLLSGPGTNKAIVEAVIARLREYGYLDDARFAEGYASLRLRERPIGRRRLERDLWLKKIDKSIADKALDIVFAETPEEDLIDRAIAKRIRLRGRPKTRAETKSLFDHLLRQGFPFELVGDKVRAVSKPEIDDE